MELFVSHQILVCELNSEMHSALQEFHDQLWEALSGTTFAKRGVPSRTKRERILEMLWRLQMPWIIGFGGSQLYCWGEFQEKLWERFRGLSRNVLRAWPRPKLWSGERKEVTLTVVALFSKMERLLSRPESLCARYMVLPVSLGVFSLRSDSVIAIMSVAEQSKLATQVRPLPALPGLPQLGNV